MRKLAIYAIILVALLPFGSAVAAGLDLTQSNTSMTGLLQLIQQASDSWGPRLHGNAVAVFWSLALIQFIWTFVPLVFKQADFGELIGELIRFIMIIGFFNILLDHSTEWAGYIISSFRQAGAHAANLPTPELMPGDMFAMAVDFSRAILSGISFFNGSLNFVVALAGLIVLLCFSFIAAFVFVTLIEAYVVINAAVLFMGFGASQWTREYTLAIVRYTVSVGAKLFMVTLIVGLVLTVAEQWRAAYTNDEASLMTLIGLSLVCAYLTKTIPELIAGMINGSSIGGGTGIGSMAATAIAAAVTATASIATAGAAVAGGLGATGSKTGEAVGGLANSINTSFTGGSATGAGDSGSARTEPFGASLGSSTGGSSAAKSAGAKVGGSNSGVPNVIGSGPQPSEWVKQSSNSAQRHNDTKGSAGAAQPQATPHGDQGGSSSPQTSQQGGSGISGHQVANVLTRGAGILAAISVPGMERAATMGGEFGSNQPQVDNGFANERSSANSIEVSEAPNIIRPTQEPAAARTPSSYNTEKPEFS